MKKLAIKRTGEKTPSEIIFTEELQTELDNKTCDVKGKIFIITDDNIYNIYKDSILEKYTVIHFPSGESHKTLSTVEELNRQLVEKGANRESFIIGFGGGIVTDVAGFTASTYMRGVKFGFIPTSLLAMVDAAIGGKNGVNLDGYKNMIGCFRQPEWTIISPSILDTLPKREFNAGMAEVLKYALIYDRDMFENLYSCQYNISDMIFRSAEIKADIVEQDELESGLRRVLNFGHTMAHAIEKCSHGKYLHGEAVAMGIRYIAAMSNAMNLLEEEELSKIDSILQFFDLPLSPEDLDLKDVYSAMRHDKKSTGKDGIINEILLDGIGNYQFITLDLNRIQQQ